MKYLLIIIASLVTLSIFASGDHSAPELKLKKGGAVMAFSKEDGFKLSDKAIKNLDVKFTKINGGGPWTLNKSSLVRIKHSVGVYRKWDDWITMVLVKVIKESDKTVTITSVDLQNDDQVAISGVSFLRMTEADLNSDTVDSCAH